MNLTPQLKLAVVPTGKRFGYNPSLLIFDGKTIQTYRHHPDLASWRTELVISVDGVESKLEPPLKYKLHSFEDARLWLFNGRPYISATVAMSRQNGQTLDPCVVGYGELDLTNPAGIWLKNWVEPKHPDNAWQKKTKNVVPWEADGRLLCTFRTSPQHEVLSLNPLTGQIIQKWESETVSCNFGTPRGGTQVFDYQGHWLRFVHVLQANRKSDSWWQYNLAAVLIEKTPPFRIVKISEHPILSGNEAYEPDCPHWKPKILIPYGAVAQHGGWRVAVGVNDVQCATVDMKPEDLNL